MEHGLGVPGGQVSGRSMTVGAFDRTESRLTLFSSTPTFLSRLEPEKDAVSSQGSSRFDALGQGMKSSSSATDCGATLMGSYTRVITSTWPSPRRTGGPTRRPCTSRRRTSRPLSAPDGTRTPAPSSSPRSSCGARPRAARAWRRMPCCDLRKHAGRRGARVRHRECGRVVFALSRRQAFRNDCGTLTIRSALAARIRRSTCVLPSLRSIRDV